MTKKLTQSQVNKRFGGKYIKFIKTYDYTRKCWLYEVDKRTFKEIRENTTLGEDVGTNLEYSR